MSLRLRKTVLNLWAAAMLVCLLTLVVGTHSTVKAQASTTLQTQQAAEVPVNEGDTTGWANVRSGPTTSASIVRTIPINHHVLIYEEVIGENAWGTTSIWYRITPHDQAPQYIYSGLVAVIK